MHSQSEARALFDQQGDVLPEVTLSKSDQRVARVISPRGGGGEFFHYRGMSSLKRLDLLIIRVEHGTRVQTLECRLISVDFIQVSILTPGLLGLQRKSVMVITPA